MDLCYHMPAKFWEKFHTTKIDIVPKTGGFNSNFSTWKEWAGLDQISRFVSTRNKNINCFVECSQLK